LPRRDVIKPLEKKRAGYTCPDSGAHDPALLGVKGWGTNGPVNRIRRVPPRKTMENHVLPPQDFHRKCERERELRTLILVYIWYIAWQLSIQPSTVVNPRETTQVIYAKLNRCTNCNNFINLKNKILLKDLRRCRCYFNGQRPPSVVTGYILIWT